MIDENSNINFIKKNKIHKSLKEIAEKYGVKISEGYRKIVKKFWFKSSALEERCFIKYNCETGWTNNHKKCYKCGSEEYTKEHVLNKYPVFELWRNRTRKKIGCNNICLWFDNNIFKSKYKTMNDHKIKLIRSILNDFYKDKKMYLKNLKIRYTVIKYKKSK